MNLHIFVSIPYRDDKNEKRKKFFATADESFNPL